MKPDFYLNTGDGWGIGITIVVLLLWLLGLIELLKRQDMEDVDKIVWTVVVCTLNILGLLLYLFMAPSEKGKTRARTDEELKEYFNTRPGDSEK